MRFFACWRGTILRLIKFEDDSASRDWGRHEVVSSHCALKPSGLVTPLRIFLAGSISILAPSGNPIPPTSDSKCVLVSVGPTCASVQMPGCV